MDDLFIEEQKILYDGFLYLDLVKDGEPFDVDKYEELLMEYRKLLKQLRRATKMADRHTTNLHESNLNLIDKVNYDGLTGIFNRRFLDDSLKRILNTILRSGNGLLSVMMLDIDFFKRYNDTYGHAKGDYCLQEIAKVLESTMMRSDDFVARYGGEEFAIIMPNTDENGACAMARKILENVRMRNIPHEQNEVANCVTISIGVTTGSVDNTQSGLEYIKRADKALYMSKQNGRNRYTYIKFKDEIEKNIDIEGNKEI